MSSILALCCRELFSLCCVAMVCEGFPHVPMLNLGLDYNLSPILKSQIFSNILRSVQYAYSGEHFITSLKLQCCLIPSHVSSSPFVLSSPPNFISFPCGIVFLNFIHQHIYNETNFQGSKLCVCRQMIKF